MISFEHVKTTILPTAIGLILLYILFLYINQSKGSHF